MKRVLLVGLDPATVDFLDPALPPGMSVEKIHAGVKVALADMAERGWQTENCFINPDETAAPTVERRLAEGRYDCVVIGGRCPPSAEPTTSVRGASQRHPPRRSGRGHRLQHPPGRHRRGRGALDLSTEAIHP